MTAGIRRPRLRQGIDLRVLGDFDDPAVLVRDILKSFNLPTPTACCHQRPHNGRNGCKPAKNLPDAVLLGDEFAALRVVGRKTKWL